MWKERLIPDTVISIRKKYFRWFNDLQVNETCLIELLVLENNTWEYLVHWICSLTTSNCKVPVNDLGNGEILITITIKFCPLWPGLVIPVKVTLMSQQEWFIIISDWKLYK